MNQELIDGVYVEPGDLLVGLREDGLGSFGLDAAQDVFEFAFGENWHNELIEISGQRHKLGELAMRPPAVYTKTVMDMNGSRDIGDTPKVQVSGIAEIGSGGIPEQLGRTLKRTGLGTEVIDPFEPPTIAMLAQAFHPDNIPDEDAYRTWCFGQGMIIITPETDADGVIQVASEHGIAAKVIGYVTKQPGIRIRSAGIHKAGKMLSFET